MPFALTNLDNGLFLEEGGWTVEYRYAQNFKNRETVAQAAIDHKVRNAAAAMMDEGEPPKVMGFLWLTKPN